jgi:hypothetical protein
MPIPPTGVGTYTSGRSLLEDKVVELGEFLVA